LQLRDTITRALIRPGSYLGWLRELLVTGVCLVCYPFGIGDTTPESPSGVLPTPTSALEGDSAPVLLVHGYGHNRSGWTFLARHLRRGGFDHVYSLNYNPLAGDLPGLAWDLARRIDAIREVTGARRVHLVGHSLGGILIRYYVQLLGGDTCVDTAITLASPHEGTLAAGLGRSSVLRQLRPGSWVIRALEETARPSPVQWMAYYSNLDALVQPASSAMLRHPALDATNVLVKDHGHLSILLAPGLGRSIAHRLAAPGGLDGARAGCSDSGCEELVG
jgi:triacylglycerol lipase